MDGSKTKRASRRWFDRRADGYERGLDSGWLARMQREALGALELKPDDRFLDVGCGPGATVRQTASLVDLGIGVDLAPRMIARAAALAGNGARFCVADSERLPFGSGTFSALLCSTSFHHYPDPQQAVREMARVIRPGGRLVLADACADAWGARVADLFLRRLEPGHVRLYGSAELAGFLQGAGLGRIRFRTLSSGGYAIAHAIRPA